MIFTNTTLTYKIDSLVSITDSMKDLSKAQLTKMDTICNVSEHISIGQEGLRHQVDSIQTQLQSISEYGIGYSEMATHITMPLIIALFAFAFPFLFTVISHINSKYESEEITSLFSSEKSYKWFLCGAYISAIYLVFRGLLSLCLVDTSCIWVRVIMDWTSIIVAGGYSFIILHFVRTCISYNNPQKIIDRIDDIFKNGEKKVQAYLKKIEKEEKKNAMIKSEGKRNFNAQGISIKKSYAYYHIEEDRVTQWVEICKYAFRKHDYSLFLIILQKAEHAAHPDSRYKDQKFDFFDKLIDAYIPYQPNDDIEKTIMRDWFLLFNKSEIPNRFRYFVYRMIGKMVSAAMQGRIGLFEKYIQSASYGYSFINQIQLVSYVKGESVEEQKRTDEDRLELWLELCEMHYLILAHLFSNGYYDAVKAVLSSRNIGYGKLFPGSGTETLKLYARCKEKQNNDGTYHYILIDKVLGENTDVDMLEKVTAFLLLVYSNSSYPRLDIISDTRLKLIIGKKDNMAKYAEAWSESAELKSYFPQIPNRDFNKLFDANVKRLKMTEQGMNVEWEGLIIIPDNIRYRRRNIQPRDDIFNTAIPEKTKENVRNMFYNILYGNSSYILDGLIGINNEQKTEKILWGELHLMIDKQVLMTSEMFFVSSIFNNMLNIFRSRYLYVVYSALSRMQIKDETISIDNFEQYFTGLVGEKGSDYIIIDSNSHMNLFYKMDALANGQRFSIHRTYKGADYKDYDLDVGWYLRDLEVLEPFKNTLVIVKKIDLPALVKTSTDDVPNVEYKDESDSMNGTAKISMVINPNYESQFDKGAIVTRLRLEKPSKNKGLLKEWKLSISSSMDFKFTNLKCLLKKTLIR